MSTTVATARAQASANQRPYDVVCSSEDRDAWLTVRKTGIGASEIAATFGESRWKSAIGLYAEKIGAPQDDEETEAQFWGLKLERIIAEVYAARTGRQIQWSGLMLRSKEHPWALATLDAETWEQPGDTPWPFDSKTATVFKQGEWADGPPHEYYLQAQQQMLVTGASCATIACLIGGQRQVWCDIERDDVAIRRIIHMGRIFWERCVQARVPPAPDGSVSAAQSLLKLYPAVEPSFVQLDASFDEIYDELRELKLTEKALCKRRTAIENEFKAALGTAESGITPCGNRVTWKSRRGQISYKGCVEELGATPAQVEKHRGKPTRVFELHEPKER